MYKPVPGLVHGWFAVELPAEGMVCTALGECPPDLKTKNILHRTPRQERERGGKETHSEGTRSGRDRRQTSGSPAPPTGSDTTPSSLQILPPQTGNSCSERTIRTPEDRR